MTTTADQDKPAVLIADPTELDGFTITADGVLASYLGDAGEWILLLGHHDHETARAAARQLLATSVDEAEVALAMRYAGAPRHRYARFGYDDDPQDWGCDFDHAEPGPGLAAVTIIDMG
jgi:hypothetical protein